MSTALPVLGPVETAGDMPSSVAPAVDPGQEDAQPFAEVLSQSAPDLPLPPAAPAAPVTPQPDQPARDEPATDEPAGTRTSAAPGPFRTRRPSPTDPADPGDGRAPGATVAPIPSWRAAAVAGNPDPGTDPVPPSAGSAAVPGGTRSGAVAASAAAGSGSPVVPVAGSSPTVSSVPPGEHAAPGAAPESGPEVGPGGGADWRRSAEAGPPPAPGESPVTGGLPPTAGGAGSLARATGMTAADVHPVVVSGGATAHRSGADGRGPAGPAVPGDGPVHIQVSGPTSGEAAAGLSVGATGPVGAIGPTAAGDGPESPQLPDGAGGVTAAGVDIGGLAASITRPLAAGNGDYSVRVSLHPPELGEVRALLSLQGDVLHVTLTPEHAAGHDAIADAMSDLHDQLAGGGVEVNVILGRPGDPDDRHGRQAADGGPAGSDPLGEVSPAVTALPSSGDPGRIHLVL
jgi:hypothetical protein